MSKNKRPVIDIILCSYNQEDFIGKALEGVERQKVDAEVRVIVADDCSTDKTLDIIKEREQKIAFPFVYLTAESNIGMKANYKRAFAACKGDYVAILEGDDWWHKENHLSQHLEFLERHRRYSMSFNRITYYKQEQGETLTRRWLYDDVDHLTINLREQISWGNQIGNLSSCMFRTALLHKLPEAFYGLNYADWEIGIMMALKGPIAMLRESTSTYRINDRGQWSALSSEGKLDSQIDTLTEIRPFLPSYSERYIRAYRKMMEKGEECPYPVPMKYRIKRLLKKK